MPFWITGAMALRSVLLVEPIADEVNLNSAGHLYGVGLGAGAAVGDGAGAGAGAGLGFGAAGG